MIMPFEHEMKGTFGSNNDLFYERTDIVNWVGMHPRINLESARASFIDEVAVIFLLRLKFDMNLEFLLKLLIESTTFWSLANI